MRRVLPLVLISGLIVGCSGNPEAARIDGSSFGQYQASLDVVREQLVGPEQLRFEASLKLIEGQVFAKAKDRAEFNRMIRERLNGMTAADVIAQGSGLTDTLKGQALDAAFAAKKAAADAAGAVTGDAGAAVGGLAGQAADIAKGAAGAAIDEARVQAGAVVDQAAGVLADPQAAAEAAARKAVQDAAAEAKAQ
jgi:hypothetical protein